MDQPTEKSLDQGYQAMEPNEERIEDKDAHNSAVDALKRVCQDEDAVHSEAEVRRVLSQNPAPTVK